MIHTLQAEAVRIPADGAFLPGDLVVPAEAQGVVLFVHGSGSSRFSVAQSSRRRRAAGGAPGHAPVRPAHRAGGRGSRRALRHRAPDPATARRAPLRRDASRPDRPARGLLRRQHGRGGGAAGGGGRARGRRRRRLARRAPGHGRRGARARAHADAAPRGRRRRGRARAQSPRPRADDLRGVPRGHPRGDAPVRGAGHAGAGRRAGARVVHAPPGAGPGRHEPRRLPRRERRGGAHLPRGRRAARHPGRERVPHPRLSQRGAGDRGVVGAHRAARAAAIPGR